MKRRNFLRSSAAAASAVLLSGCSQYGLVSRFAEPRSQGIGALKKDVLTFDPFLWENYQGYDLHYTGKRGQLVVRVAYTGQDTYVFARTADHLLTHAAVLRPGVNAKPDNFLPPGLTKAEFEVENERRRARRYVALAKHLKQNVPDFWNGILVSTTLGGTNPQWRGPSEIRDGQVRGTLVAVQATGIDKLIRDFYFALRKQNVGTSTATEDIGLVAPEVDGWACLGCGVSVYDHYAFIFGVAGGCIATGGAGCVVGGLAFLANSALMVYSCGTCAEGALPTYPNSAPPPPPPPDDIYCDPTGYCPVSETGR